MSQEAAGADAGPPEGRRPSPGVPTTHPPAIWFFFWGEFAERSSYYGMRAILFLYMTKVLLLSTSIAGPAYSAFKMTAYILPLAGGYIADRKPGATGRWSRPRGSGCRG